MIDTTRITSGFDVEVQIGAGWILTALGTLASQGLLISLPDEAPPDAEVTVTGVRIVFDQPPWDLEIELAIGGLPLLVLGHIELNEAGTELQITNNRTEDVTIIPFEILDDLAHAPALVKLGGNDDHEPCFALLANLNIQASPQNEEPSHVERGQADLALSFLPNGVDLAVGVGRWTFQRFANNIWHTDLRADDGTHPLPDEANKVGTWNVVLAAPQPDRVRIELLGEVPIDIWPDATVRINIFLRPETVDGVLKFTLDIYSNVDTGVLGQLFGGIIGGLVGLFLGFISGGMLLPAFAIGFGAGVLAVEVAEAVVGGYVTRLVRILVRGEWVPALTCADDVVVEAITHKDGGISLDVLGAIPTSVRIATTQPEPIHLRHILVVNHYDEPTVDENGMAFTATAREREAFEPIKSRLVDTVPVADGVPLAALIYQTDGDVAFEIDLNEAIARAADDELTPPFRLITVGDDIETALRGGRLPVVCLTPEAIRRDESVITDIRFTTGLELTVPETVMLQDAGVLILPGLQLIHPDNAPPYYRSPPDSSTENNFEELPEF